MKRVIGKDEALRLIREGWELKHSSGFDSRFWVQRKDGSADTFTVRYDSAASLVKNGLVTAVPPTDKTPYWLTRYRLTEKTP